MGQKIKHQHISVAGVDWVSANGAGDDASVGLLHHLGVEDSRDHREHCHHAGGIGKSFVEWAWRQFLDISGEFFWRKKLLQKLRERMHSRQVFNQSVCNCHEDSELVRTMIRFISLIWFISTLAVVHDRPCGVHLLLPRQDQPHLLLAAASRREHDNIIKVWTTIVFHFESLGEIYQFLDDFDQHMEEEESIFQPLLNQYATFSSHSVKKYPAQPVRNIL